MAAAATAFEQAIAAIQRRGLIHSASPNLAASLGLLIRGNATTPLSSYAGFDPTGPSLHLGHLAVVLGLRRLQQAGIRPIALVRLF